MLSREGGAPSTHESDQGARHLQASPSHHLLPSHAYHPAKKISGRHHVIAPSEPMGEEELREMLYAPGRPGRRPEEVTLYPRRPVRRARHGTSRRGRRRVQTGADIGTRAHQNLNDLRRLAAIALTTLLLLCQTPAARSQQP